MISMKRWKKLWIGVIVSMMVFAIQGCGSKDTTDKAEEKGDGLKSALQKSEALSGYQIDAERSGKDLHLSGSTFSIEDVAVQTTTMVQKQDKTQYVYMKSKMEGNLQMSSLSVYRDKQQDVINMMPLHHPEQQLFQSYGKKDKTTYRSDFQDLLDYVDDGKYASYFQVSEKKEDKNTYYTLTCIDTKGWMDAVVKEGKKKDPSYDPLNYQGQKLEKKEYKDCSMELVVGDDGFIHQYVHQLRIDYGDNLMSDMKTTRIYSKWGESLLNTSFADELCDKAGNNEYRQDDTIDMEKLLS